MSLPSSLISKPPTTPSNRSSSVQLLNQSNFNSTPYNPGLSSRNTEDQDHSRDNYEMFLRNDLNYVAPEVTMQEFCAHILRTSTYTPSNFTFNVNSEKVDSVCTRLSQLYASNRFEDYAPCANSARADAIINSPTFIELRNAYADQKLEENRYEPFVKLVNFILQELRGRDSVDTDLVFVRHSGQMVRGYVGYDRYPDIVGIREKTKMIEVAGKWESRSSNWDKNGPDLKPMHYRELLFFVELEQEKNQTSEMKTKPYVSSDPIPSVDTSASKASGSKIVPAQPSSSQAVNSAPEPSSSTSLKFSASGDTGLSGPMLKPKMRKSALQAPSTAGNKASAKRRVPDDTNSSNKPIAKRPKRQNPVSQLSSTLTTSQTTDSSVAGSEALFSDPRGTKAGLGYDIKCADYAAGFFTYGGFRKVVLGMRLNGNDLRLTLYGRSVIVRTSRFNFLADPLQFVALLEGLDKMNDAQLGVNIALDTSRVDLRDPITYKGATLAFDIEGEKVPVTVEEKIHNQLALIGRGSFIAKSAELTLPRSWQEKLQHLRNLMQGEQTIEFPQVNRVIIKINSVPRTRTSEYDFIKRAIDEVNKDGEQSRWVLLRLPFIFYGDELMPEDETSIRAAFMLATCRDYVDCEVRVSRVLIAEELQPITEINDPYELLLAYRDCIEAHKWLVDIGVLHRDISLKNLMIRTVTIGGRKRRYGVVNDLDLAVSTDRDNDAPIHKQRTGTKPFMARDLLKGNNRHWPRHDLESFFYTYYYNVISIHNGVEISSNPLNVWKTLDFVALYDKKSTFWVEDDLEEHTPNFKPLSSTTIELYELMQEGFNSWTKHRSNARRSAKKLKPYNIKTLDGHFTHVKFIEVLSNGLRLLEEEGKSGGYIVPEPYEVQFKRDDSEDWDSDNDVIVKARLEGQNKKLGLMD